MEDDDIKDCIDQIKLSLPSDDNSHFTMNGGDGNDKAGEGATTLDTLWDTYEQITEAGLDDKSEEGQDLRASIMEFIEANGLDIKPSRRDTNQDLLNDIQDIMDEADFFVVFVDAAQDHLFDDAFGFAFVAGLFRQDFLFVFQFIQGYTIRFVCPFITPYYESETPLRLTDERHPYQ